jgi:hypothetical protein
MDLELTASAQDWAETWEGPAVWGCPVYRLVPGRLDALLSAVGLAVQADDEIGCTVVFQDTKDAVRAFTGSGRIVSEAVRQALTPYTRPDGRVTLPAWYRAVITK